MQQTVSGAASKLLCEAVHNENRGRLVIKFGKLLLDQVEAFDCAATVGLVVAERPSRSDMPLMRAGSQPNGFML